MRHQIPRCDPRADRGNMKLKLGHVLPHRDVPVELALVDENPESHGRERLGDRADGNRVLVVTGSFRSTSR
jgi:hypothetical protein